MSNTKQLNCVKLYKPDAFTPFLVGPDVKLVYPEHVPVPVSVFPVPVSVYENDTPEGVQF